MRGSSKTGRPSACWSRRRNGRACSRRASATGPGPGIAAGAGRPRPRAACAGRGAIRPRAALDPAPAQGARTDRARAARGREPADRCVRAGRQRRGLPRLCRGMDRVLRPVPAGDARGRGRAARPVRRGAGGPAGGARLGGGRRPGPRRTGRPRVRPHEPRAAARARPPRRPAARSPPSPRSGCSSSWRRCRGSRGREAARRPAAGPAPAPERAVAAALDPLFGYPLPADLWETAVLPARVPGYRPAWLDALLHDTDLIWLGVKKSRLDLLPRAGAIALVAREGRSETLFPDPQARYAFWELAERTGPRERRAHAPSLGARLGRASRRPTASRRCAAAPPSGSRRRPPWSREASRGRRQPVAAAGSASTAGSRRGRPTAPGAPCRRPAAAGRGGRGRAGRRSDLPDPRSLWYRVPRAARVGAARTSGGAASSGRLRVLELAGEVVGGVFFEGIEGPQFVSPAGLRALGEGLPEGAFYWMSAADPASLCGVRVAGLALPRRLAGTLLAYAGARPGARRAARGRRRRRHGRSGRPAARGSAGRPRRDRRARGAARAPPEDRADQRGGRRREPVQGRAAWLPGFRDEGRALSLRPELLWNRR